MLHTLLVKLAVMLVTYLRKKGRLLDWLMPSEIYSNRELVAYSLTDITEKGEFIPSLGTIAPRDYFEISRYRVRSSHHYYPQPVEHRIYRGDNGEFQTKFLNAKDIFPELDAKDVESLINTLIKVHTGRANLPPETKVCKLMGGWAALTNISQ